MLIEPLTFKEFGAATVAAKELQKSQRDSLFARSRKNDEPEAPPPPTFSEEELKAAERDAYQRGFLDGVNDGITQAQNEHADIEKLLMERLESFAESIAPIFERYKAHCLQLRQDMPPLALAIAKKVAGKAIDGDYEEVIEKAAKHCAEAMLSEPNVTISINEKLAGVLSQKLNKLNGKVPSSAHIEVIASDYIPHGDYKIEWKNGGMERSHEKIWQLMDKAVANMLSAIANEKEEQLDLLNGITSNGEQNG